MSDPKSISKILEASNYIYKTQRIHSKTLSKMDSPIHKEYESIIKECIFISKPEEWFIEGYQVELNAIYYEFKSGFKFNYGSGLFVGLTDEGFKEYTGDLPRLDGESCALDEFEIYDKWGNEISELTLSEYKSLLRDLKIEEITNQIT
jgi:hypothetical protein